MERVAHLQSSGRMIIGTITVQAKRRLKGKNVKQCQSSSTQLKI